MQKLTSHLARGPTRLVSLQAGVLGVVTLVSLALFAFEFEGPRVAICVLALVIALLGYQLLVQSRLRIAAERAAADALAQSRLLAESSTDFVVRLDLDFVCRYLSPACRAILGYAPEALVGTAALSLIHPDDRERLDELRLAMAAGRERTDLTARIRHSDGHWAWGE